MDSKDRKVSMIAYLVLSFCVIFFLYEFFLRAFVGTLAQRIIHDLNLTPELFALMSAAYYLAYGLMQFPGGYLTERFGAKKILIFASLTCAVSIFLFSIAQGFVLGFFARLLMGFGSAFGFISLLVVIANWFPQKMHTNVIGFSIFLGTLGPLLAGGPLATVVLNSDKSWNFIFQVIGLFGVLFALLVLLLFRSKRRTHKSNLVELDKKRQISSIIKSLIKNKQVWAVVFYSSFTYEIIDFLGAVWGTFFLQSRGLSLKQAGFTVSSGWLGYAVGCFAVSLFSQWIKKRKPALILCSLTGLLSVVLAIYFPLPSLFVYLVLFFLIGLSAAGSNLGISVILEHVESSAKALALGFNSGFMLIFAATIPILSSAFIHLPKDQPAQPANFLWGFSILPILFLGSLIIAVFGIKETFCRPQKTVIRLSL